MCTRTPLNISALFVTGASFMAGRSAGSTCLCVLEAVLAATVFFYTALGLAHFTRSFAFDGHSGFVHKAIRYVPFAALLLLQTTFGIVLLLTGNIGTGWGGSLPRQVEPAGNGR